MLFLQQRHILVKCSFWYVYYGSFRLQFCLCLFLFLLFLIFLMPVVLLLRCRITMIFKWSGGLFTGNWIGVGLAIIILRHCLGGFRVCDKGLFVAGVLVDGFEGFGLDFALFVHCTLNNINCAFIVYKSNDWFSQIYCQLSGLI